MSGLGTSQVDYPDDDTAALTGAGPVSGDRTVLVPAADNALQGDFGEAWLEAVAAGCRLLHGRPSTLDLDKADVEVTLLGIAAGTYNPTVKVQVKTEVNLRETRMATLFTTLTWRPTMC